MLLPFSVFKTYIPADKLPQFNFPIPFSMRECNNSLPVKSNNLTSFAKVDNTTNCHDSFLSADISIL